VKITENMEENTRNEPVAVLQEKYLHDKYATIFLLLIVLVVLGVGLFGLLFLLKNAAFPPPTYFPATEADQLIQEASLDQPEIQEPVLLNWLTEAMMAAHTFNFINYTSVINAAKVSFTPEGYASYQSVLTNQKIIDQVVNKKYVLKASAADAPQILLSKPFAGRYMWKIADAF